MKDISTIQISLFLRTSVMMICLMASLRTGLKRHDRKIGKKNP